MRTLRMFEDRELWRVSELKKQEVTGGWITLNNEEFRNLSAS
jgi:hypothetical protein